MKYEKKHLIPLFLLGSALFTCGCYPGNVSKVESEAQSDAGYISNVSDSNETSTLNQKIHINVSQEEIESQDHKSAYIGMKATLHKWDYNKVKQTFDFAPDEILDEKIINQGKEIYHVTLTDGGDFAAGNGFIYFTKNRFANKRMIYVKDFEEYKTPSLCFEAFPYEELDNFSKEDAIQMFQHYIEGLDLHIDSDPLIYAMDEESMNRIKNEYDEQHPEDTDNYPTMTKDDEAYRICYRFLPNNVPILESSIPPRDDENAILGCVCNAIMTRDGLQWLEIANYVDIDVSEAEEISICNAQSALETVASNMEKSVLTSDNYIENLSFCYGLQVDRGTEDHFHLIPLWTMGSYNNFVQSENGHTIAEKIPVLHFVNPETGKER